MNRSSTQSTAETVVEAVARHEDVEPTALDRPLYAAIDPDALDSLFRETTGEVTFRYLDTVVTVTDDGRVSVRDVDPADS